MARALALNVGANTNEPGFRGPLYPDGTFDYLPIPETEPAESVPTYGDLDPHLRFDVPERVWDTPVHLDPAFVEYADGEAYTYGDPHGVKAKPLLNLHAGDHLYFYATLERVNADEDEPAWTACVIGEFRLAHDPLSGDKYHERPADEREAFASNAHVKRDTMDARALVVGDSSSELYERAVPLGDGTKANRLVTDYSEDSGKGPWWRRPLRFEGAGAERFREAVHSFGR